MATPRRTLSLHEFRKRTSEAMERAAGRRARAYRVDMLCRLHARLDRRCSTDTLAGKRCRNHAEPLSPVCGMHKRRPSLAMLLSPTTLQPSEPDPPTPALAVNSSSPVSPDAAVVTPEPEETTAEELATTIEDLEQMDSLADELRYQQGG